MFQKFKNDKIFSNWFLLATYVIILSAVMLNFSTFEKDIFNIIWVFKPFFYAIAFAFILNIPMVFIETFIRKRTKLNNFMYRKSRTISIIITIIFAFAILSLLSLIIIPKLIESIVTLLSNIGGLLTGLITNIDKILLFFKIDISLLDMTSINEIINLDWPSIFSTIIKFLGTTTGGVISVVGNFGVSLGWAFAGFMLSLYLLAKKEVYLLQARKLVTVFLGVPKARKLLELSKSANQIFRSFIGGQLTDAVIQAVLYWGVFKLLGFPFAELMATVIAVFALVPVFGPTLSMFVNGLLLLTVKSPLFVIFYIVLYQIIQQFDNNVIYPRVVGNQVGLPGIWVLLSIFVFGDLFGLLGMLIAVPTTAFIYVVLGDYVRKVLKQRKVNVTLNEIEEEIGIEN